MKQKKSINEYKRLLKIKRRQKFFKIIKIKNKKKSKKILKKGV